MSYNLKAFQDLVEAFKMFPGIGTKTAERMSLFLMKSHPEKSEHFAKTVLDSRKRVRLCSSCNLFTEEPSCEICRDTGRDHGLICVIEEPKDAFMLERTGSYRGVYHVLMGKISPLDGIGPENLKIAQLLERIGRDKPREVILATGMDVEGEATAVYLARQIAQEGILVTRIAYGIPVGMGLDYADELTLSRALEARRRV